LRDRTESPGSEIIDGALEDLRVQDPGLKCQYVITRKSRILEFLNPGEFLMVGWRNECRYSDMFVKDAITGSRRSCSSLPSLNVRRVRARQLRNSCRCSTWAAAVLGRLIDCRRRALAGAVAI